MADVEARLDAATQAAEESAETAQNEIKEIATAAVEVAENKVAAAEATIEILTEAALRDILHKRCDEMEALVREWESKISLLQTSQATMEATLATIQAQMITPEALELRLANLSVSPIQPPQSVVIAEENPAPPITDPTQANANADDHAEPEPKPAVRKKRFL